jgi:hypothetical protein
VAKAKQQSSKRAPGTNETVNKGSESVLQSDITLISDDEHGAKPPNPATYMRARRPRNRREPPPDMDIDGAVIGNLSKMCFELLLVMLMREDGRVTLTQTELDSVDDERHNICFALSLDNKTLEVFIVNRQSGIIRSPEANAWASQPNAAALQPGSETQTITPATYNAPPPPPVLTEAELREQAQNIVQDWQRAGFGGSGAQPEETRIVEMPNPQQAKAKAAQEMVFPFQVGSTPQNAQQVNLSDLQNKLISQDREIAQQEAAAAARVEGSSSG